MTNYIRLLVAFWVLCLISCASSAYICEYNDNGICKKILPKQITQTDSIILIYYPGSMGESTPDPCQPNNSRSAFSAPKVIVDLQNKAFGKRPIRVFTHCTKSKLGDFNSYRLKGEPKLIKRIKDIDALIEALHQNNHPANRIFLAGHSAGAWAILQYQSLYPEKINGTISFAPAFSGLHISRNVGWRSLRLQLIEHIQAAEQMNALVYAFTGDMFEQPETLTFLKSIKGVHFKVVDSNSINGHPCISRTAHQIHRDPCFQHQGKTIVNFIQNSLAYPHS